MVHAGYCNIAIGASAEDNVIALNHPQPRDFECTLTVVYAVVTEALDDAGTWTMKGFDGDGTSTTLATGTGTGTTIATHTVVFNFNKVPNTALGTFVDIAQIDGGVGTNSFVRLYSVRWQAKRQLEFIAE